jgi:prolyl-tRNA synthetase
MEPTRWSTLFFPTSAAATRSKTGTDWLLSSGYLTRVDRGVYGWLPVGQRVVAAVDRLIRATAVRLRYSEICLPMLQPLAAWEASDRYEQLGNLLTRVPMKAGQYVLNSTQEEVVEMVLASHGNFVGARLFQLSDRVRNELRPAHGLTRSLTFKLAEWYYFAESDEAIGSELVALRTELAALLERLGLATTYVQHRERADLTSVAVTSTADVRQFRYSICVGCAYTFRPEFKVCPRCGGCCEVTAAVEAADVFARAAVGALRGHRYVGAGLGVYRTLSMVAEGLANSNRLCWPRAICPFDVNIIVGDNGADDSERIAHYLSAANHSVIVDDRPLRFGRKLFDAKCLAAPLEILFKPDGRVELTDRVRAKTTVVAGGAAEAAVRILEEQ